MIGTRFLSGASGRLLPPSIPFRFFMAALVFYLLFWVALFFNAEDLTSYMIGSGPVLAMIHMATLGVLTMTVIGASLQLLSVATRKAFTGFWVCRLLSWIYIPGFMLLTYAMFASWHMGMMVGAVIAGIGLLIFFYLIIDNIRGVKGMGAIMAHCWAAMLSLLGLVLLGILLIIDMEHGIIEDHLTIALSHFILAVFGFMSLLAMGFSYILVPMFALAPAPPEKLGRLSIACNMVAIIMILTGINTHLLVVSLVGAVLAMAGVGCYLYGMAGTYRARMRKRLGVPFLLIRAGWVMLLLTIIWGVAGLMDYWPENGHTLFAVWAILGWLLTFLTGILQRIIPFLSSMHTSGSGGIPMLASAMADERFLVVNAVGHLGGLFFVALGVILDMGMVIKIGAGAGFIGAAALLYYLFIITRHMIQNQSVKP
ncbi:MAG: hypothetical protein COA81_04440 [Alphaproteobacteria bacterium]|nr:MAG: hypothetical protein COA81_04440 [Alphaproteobacteria bacterium]